MRFDLNKTYPVHYAGRMDAIHVPAILVTSIGWLYPGQYVKFVEIVDGFSKVEDCDKDESDAIVSPFLEQPVSPDTSFPVLMRPGTVEGLHHHFEIKI